MTNGEKARFYPVNASLLTASLGVPVAYMLASNNEQETHELFFFVFRSNNPRIPPFIIMDRDQAAFNAARKIYPEIPTYLCWFHAINCWWKHLRVSDHPEAWALLLQLPRAETWSRFMELWNGIREKVPLQFVDYMMAYWVCSQFLNTVLRYAYILQMTGCQRGQICTELIGPSTSSKTRRISLNRVSYCSISLEMD